MNLKNAILFLLLTSASATASADWQRLAHYGTADDYARHTQYVDPAAIKRLDHKVIITALSDYESEQLTKPFGGVAYLSTISAYEFDCKGKRYRTLRATLYSENMGSGNVVSEYEEAIWTAASEAEADEAALFKMACVPKK